MDNKYLEEELHTSHISYIDKLNNTIQKLNESIITSRKEQEQFFNKLNGIVELFIAVLIIIGLFGLLFTILSVFTHFIKIVF